MTWLQDWETTYQHAVALKLPDVEHERPLYDFLRAIKSNDATFLDTYFIRLNQKTAKLKPLPTMSELLKEFRNYKRILTEESKEFHLFTTF